VLKNTTFLSRRQFLHLTSLLLVTIPATSSAAASFVSKNLYSKFFDTRAISLHNPATGETLTDLEYWSPESGYDQSVLVELSWFARDFHSNKVKLFDPKIFDILNVISAILELSTPITITSGYRTKETNQYLATQNYHIAINSFHTKGQAIDFLLPKSQIVTAQRIAKHLKFGGVGYYTASKFLHIDTGPVRSWVSIY